MARSGIFFAMQTLLCGLLLGPVTNRLPAQVHRMESAAPGLNEAGAHRFVIINKEFMGLNSPPTDLHTLPDGRLLAVAGQQVAFGDGTHWEVFSQTPHQAPSRNLAVAVDQSGEIYQSVMGGFARMEFTADGSWLLRQIAHWPKDMSTERPLPRWVIQTGRHWYWHSDSGGVLEWQPGSPVRNLGGFDTVACIFELGEHSYLGDWNQGRISIFGGTNNTPSAPWTMSTLLKNVFTTCALSWSPTEVLLGTNTTGLQLFDGRALRPFSLQGVPGQNLRINSLCQLDEEHFAAAVENVGIVQFDRKGRTQLILDSHFDHRLNRVQKLLRGTNGFVWGLLNDGLLQFQYPSRVTFYEPIISSGIATAHPCRLDGKLWLLADNQYLRGIYSEDSRLQRFVPDSPPQVTLFSASLALGLPFGGSEDGAYARTDSGWVRFDEHVRNPGILQNDPVKGWWPYYAQNEIGWIRPGHPLPELRRYPREHPHIIHNTIPDGHGNIWLEFGSGRLGRYTLTDPDTIPPKIQQYDDTNGIPNSWVQVFVVDGEARLNVADKILRFDATLTRLVEDKEFTSNFAGLGTIIGRPGRDASGRLWVTTEHGVHLFSGELGHLKKLHEPMPAGLQPYMYTFENNGVVWLHSTRRLARYDPAIPLPPAEPLRALINHVTLPSSGQVAYPHANKIPDLPFTDNSLILHLLAIGKDLDDTVSFQTRLNGPEQSWVSAGNSGSAVFNSLAEGAYLLEVRPVGRNGPGEPSQLGFTIHPPWYRTIPGYSLGFLLLLLLVWGCAWLLTYLQRLEKKRLETIVLERTNALRISNAQLALQVDEIRTLSQAIEQSPVGILLVQPDGKISFANPHAGELFGRPAAQLTGRQFPLAEPHQIAACAHLTALVEARNQGQTWQGRLALPQTEAPPRHLRLTSTPLRNPAGHISQHLVLAEDISLSISEEENRRRLEAQLFMAQKRESLGTLAGGIAHDFNNILTGILGYNEIIGLTLGENTSVSQELAAIRSAGQRAKELVSQILAFTRQGHAQLKPVDLAHTVAEAIKLVRATFPTTIAIELDLQPGLIRADATKIHQIVLNLSTNAMHAMRSSPGRLEVRTAAVDLNSQQAREIGGLSAGQYLRLTVSDTGEGMDRETLERIFDPFFTTKGPGEGTGLGLSIVQSIVAHHQGGMFVRSAKGQGTAFELYFPRCHECSPVTTPPLAVPAGNAQELIVVDDEPMVTGFLAVRLNKAGYRPTVFNDPRLALDAILAAPSRYQAIITDLTMPHMTGVELIRRLQEKQITLPTLIITGYNLNATRADLATLPHCQILLKPFSGEELATALHRVLQTRTTTPGVNG